VLAAPGALAERRLSVLAVEASHSSCSARPRAINGAALTTLKRKLLGVVVSDRPVSVRSEHQARGL